MDVHILQMWQPFLELYSETYAELKKAYPDLPVFATVTLHNLTNQGWEDLEEQQAEMKKFLEDNDVAGISYYPFMAGQSEKPVEMFDWIRSFTDKPLAITETGFPAEDIILKTYNVEISGTPEKQKIYFETLLDRATCLLESAHEKIGILGAAVKKARQSSSLKKQAACYRDEVFTAMKELREDIDALEILVPRAQWPVPTYGDMLFKL